jgi:hypothetical protein
MNEMTKSPKSPQLFVRLLLCATIALCTLLSSNTSCMALTPSTDGIGEIGPILQDYVPEPTEPVYVPRDWGVLVIAPCKKPFAQRHPKIYKAWRKTRHVAVVIGPVVGVASSVGSILIQVLGVL